MHADGLLALQRTAGNRAVTALLSSSLRVTPDDHPFEQQAELAEGAMARSARLPGAPVSGSETASSRRPSLLATDAGVALDPSIQRRIGTDQGSTAGIRVHAGEDADALTTSLDAEAMTHGSDVFVSRRHYQPGTAQGDRLLAHEATHATGAAAASGQIHLKRTTKHLDFLRIKKKKTHIGREIAYRVLKKVGADKKADKVMTDKQGEEYDTYGHWWIEGGHLTDPADMTSWRPAESYGWWPATGVGLLETLKINRVEGALNQGHAHDPHHGDSADTEYHPILSVEDSADYATVRDTVMGDVRNFAHGFTGSWNWRLAWGKNCHTFIDRLKKRLKLHHQSAKGWLRGDGVKQAVVVTPGKSFDQIRGLWDMFRGLGYGSTNNFRVMTSLVKLADLAALNDEQKTELVSIMNDGVAGWNRVKADEINRALSDNFAGDGLGADDFNLFHDRHVLPEGGGGVTPVVRAFDADAFLAGMEAKSVKTLTADLVLDTTTVKAGTQIMIVAVSDDKVKVEPAGSRAQVWVEPAKLAAALGLA
jgi:hypothetical protein